MKQQLLSTLATSRNYTLAVAEAMPEDLYKFKPIGAGWNFLEQMHHIAYGIEWWKENFISGNQTEWNQPPAKSNKKEVITYLNNAYDSLEKTINKINSDNDPVRGFYATIDHITHHRGQAVAYLRCSNIEPPEYTH